MQIYFIIKQFYQLELDHRVLARKHRTSFFTRINHEKLHKELEERKRFCYTLQKIGILFSSE